MPIAEYPDGVTVSEPKPRAQTRRDPVPPPPPVPPRPPMMPPMPEDK